MSLQEKLQQLNLLDRQIRGMRGRLDAAVRRQTAQQRKFEQLQQQTTELNSQLKHAQVQMNAQELQAAEIEARVVKLRDQMNSVTSNKEYQAMLVEINTLKLDKSKIDDQTLEQMTTVEELKQRQEELVQAAAAQGKMATMAQAEVGTAREAVGDQLDELTVQRDAAVTEVPDDARSVFERMSEANDGEAMAGVEEQDRRRREYICGGCYIQLPLEMVNSLIIRPDVLVICPNCSRILYLNQELKEALASK